MWEFWHQNKNGGRRGIVNPIPTRGKTVFCMIAQNGNFLKIGTQFSLKDVEVVVSCVLDLVRSSRVAFKSRVK